MKRSYNRYAPPSAAERPKRREFREPCRVETSRPRWQNTVFTLVKHSASYTGKAEFIRAVEALKITGGRAQNRVESAGGLIIIKDNPYKVAEIVNYPPGVEGHPRVEGQFSTMTINNLQIYIPNRGDIDRIKYKEVK